MATFFDLEVRRAVDNPQQIRDAVKEGLSIAWFDQLAVLFGTTPTNFAEIVGIDPRTLSRRRKEGKLTPKESSTLYHLAVLYVHAMDVLGDAETVKTWLHSPEPDFAELRPFDILDTAPGIKEVNELLGRIEYGVF